MIISPSRNRSRSTVPLRNKTCWCIGAGLETRSLRDAPAHHYEWLFHISLDYGQRHGLGDLPKMLAPFRARLVVVARRMRYSATDRRFHCRKLEVILIVTIHTTNADSRVLCCIIFHLLSSSSRQYGRVAVPRSASDDEVGRTSHCSGTVPPIFEKHEGGGIARGIPRTLGSGVDAVAVKHVHCGAPGRSPER